MRRFVTLFSLAVCVAAALVFRRFAFVAWYPVAMSAAVSLSFALSLRGRPLCLVFAERIPPGILPEGAEGWCRRWTAIWAAWLAANGVVAAATVFAPGPVWRLEGRGIDVPAVWVVWNCCLSYVVMGMLALSEYLLRRRRFAVTFHTSGSTAEPKKIVKSFRSLALEVAYHRRRLERKLAEKPKFLSTVEKGHMYGTLWRVMLPKACGCEVDDDVIRSPEELIAKMKAEKSVVLVTTPGFLDRLGAYAEQYEIPRNAVEVVTSGSLLRAETSAAAMRMFGIAPLEIFGSTETGGVAWRRQSESDEWEVFAPVKAEEGEEGRIVVMSPFCCEKMFIMGDAVEFSQGRRRFRLLGRRDRMAKIEEQRVSLPEMEEKIRAMSEIGDAALCVLDGARGSYLGLVATVPGGVVAHGGKRRFAMELRRRMAAFFPVGTVPRRFRFVWALPRNAQGKVQDAELRRLLESGWTEPSVVRSSVGEGTFEADLVFDPDAECFKGHFPSFPILPGVVQLGTAVGFVRAVAAEHRPLRMAKNVKFSRPIFPGDIVRMSLCRTRDAEWKFRYVKGDVRCAEGTLCF